MNVARRRAGAVALLCAVLLGAPGRAQETSPTEPGPPPRTVEDLAREIEALKGLIEEQRVLLAEQQKSMGEKSREIEDLKQRIESMTRRLDELQEELPAAESQRALEERLKRVEETSSKTPEIPPDVVSAGDFPGSIRIPGTDAAIKLGGRVRAALVATLDPLGTIDRFLTHSIPVDPDPTQTETTQTNINANTSRFNFELRTPTGVGQMRAFIEGDFFGDGNSFRLRHAYGQFHGALVGQTWSTFSDPEAAPEDLDFEGVSSENVVRQAQIRYTWRSGEKLSWAAALETPRVSVTDGTGSNEVPDTIGRVKWRWKEGAHLQVALALRQVRAAPALDPSNFQSEPGWGLGISGVVPFHYFNLTDRFIFQVNGGRGVARYINDLSSLGGQDGAFDPATGDLEALDAFGWYLAYEHMWKRWAKSRDMNMRSSIIWSPVIVDNQEFQPDDAYHRTHRLSANLVFSPIRRLDVGLQYVWGKRIDKSGDSGTAAQLQWVVLFQF